jgi:hypothetical protein
MCGSLGRDFQILKSLDPQILRFSDPIRKQD